MWMEYRKGKYVAAERIGEKIRRKVLSSDKTVAAVKFGAMVRRQERKDADMVDPYEVHRKRPIEEHVKDWIDYLTEKGASDSYIRICEGRITRLVEECGWKHLSDIKADDFEGWRVTAKFVPVGFIEGKKVTEKALSARGKNHYFECLRTFCRWCVKRGRMAENPARTIERLPEVGTGRRARRAYTPEELERLLKVVPQEYRLVYLAAVFTGLRRAELEALEWGDVKLNAPLPFIQLRAETTKARRSDTVAIRADLAEALRNARGDAQDADNVFPRVPTIAQHKRWLGKAEIDWTDRKGRRADFHSLRTSLGTMLNRAGVPVGVAMKVMRHTDVKLTTNVYNDQNLADMSAAVGLLPGIGTGQTDRAEMLRTGTDDLPGPMETGDQNLGVAPGVARPTFQGQKPALKGANDGKSEMAERPRYKAVKALIGADGQGPDFTAMGGTRTHTPFGTGT